MARLVSTFAKNFQVLRRNTFGLPFAVKYLFICASVIKSGNAIRCSLDKDLSGFQNLTNLT